jgi:hypothetical protein
MPSINFWSRSSSTVQLDQRSRVVRLRLERIKRPLSHAAMRQSRLRRLLSLFSVGEYGGEPQKSRVRGPLNPRRPSRLPTFLEVQLGVSSFDELVQKRPREIAILVVDRLDPCAIHLEQLQNRRRLTQRNLLRTNTGRATPADISRNGQPQHARTGGQPGLC